MLSVTREFGQIRDYNCKTCLYCYPVICFMLCNSIMWKWLFTLSINKTVNSKKNTCPCLFTNHKQYTAQSKAGYYADSYCVTELVCVFFAHPRKNKKGALMRWPHCHLYCTQHMNHNTIQRFQLCLSLI